jgi:hypothetical protein
LQAKIEKQLQRQHILEVSQMPKSILLPLNQVYFPPTCVVCLSPASKRYPIQQVFTYGRRTHTITVDVPMCESHFTSANLKGPAEQATGCLGMGAGILAGIISMILLFLRWVGDNSLVTKLFVAAIVGFGVFILVWWVIAILIAPLLAVPEAREARNAVRITRYLPGEQMVQLTFVHEQMAFLLEKANRLS